MGPSLETSSRMPREAGNTGLALPSAGARSDCGPACHSPAVRC